MLRKTTIIVFSLLFSFFFIEIKAQATPVINSFTVSSAGQPPATNITVPVGTAITFSWSTSGAISCNSNGDLGNFDPLRPQGPSDLLTVSIVGSFSQTLYCGNNSKTVSVTVTSSSAPLPAPTTVSINSFTVQGSGGQGPAQSITVPVGTNLTFYWSTLGATSCFSNGDLGNLGPVTLQGPSTAQLITTTVGGPFTQTLTCNGVSRDVSVTVTSGSGSSSAIPTPPASTMFIDSFTVSAVEEGPARSISVPSGTRVKFDWSTRGTNPDSCSTTGTLGILPIIPSQGPLSYNLPYDLRRGLHTQTIICGGSVQKTVTINVLAGTTAGASSPSTSGLAPASTPTSAVSPAVSSGTTAPSSLSFTVDNAVVNSGNTTILRVVIPPGLNISSATLECLNNSDDAISLFYINGPATNIYCGPSTGNIPYGVSTQTFPATIRLINNTGAIASAGSTRDVDLTIKLVTQDPSGTKNYRVVVKVKASTIVRATLPPVGSSPTSPPVVERGTLVVSTRADVSGGDFPAFRVFAQGVLGSNPANLRQLYDNDNLQGVYRATYMPARINDISTGVFDVIAVATERISQLRRGVKIGSNPDHITNLFFNFQRTNAPATPSIIRFIRVNGADAITIPSGEAVRLDAEAGDAFTASTVVSFDCAYVNPAYRESIILGYGGQEFCGPRGFAGLKDGPYFLGSNPFPVNSLVVTNTREYPVTVQLRLTAYNGPINAGAQEAKYVEVTVKPVPRITLGRNPYDNVSSSMTSAETAPQPPGSFSIFLGNESSEIVSVQSGVPIVFGGGYLVNMNPASFTFECTNNSNNLVKLMHGNDIFCGDATSAFPNGPFPVDLNNLPAEVVFLNETPQIQAIGLVVEGYDTSNNFVRRSISIIVNPEGASLAPGMPPRTIGETINAIVREIPSNILNTVNTFTLFWLRVLGG